MMNSAMMMQSPHRDVLEATPDTEDSKARLVEELQTRGRAAVGAKSWMDAKLLYEKALTVMTKEMDANRVSILNSNLSLVQKNMGSFEDARKAAVAATEADPSYVKGWWRLGQALQSLHRTQEALAALSKAKELDPTNKALIKEHAKVEQKVEEEAKLMKEQAEQEAMQVEETPDTKVTSTTTTTTVQTTSRATASKSTTSTPSSSDAWTKKKQANDEGDDDKIFSKSDAVRGYKIVNGKKTSYFHNELSEEAKNLIGDIAPKKLETTPSPAASDTSTTPAASKGVSAWNKAGTWEEKDVTKWAKTALEEHLMQTKYVLPDSSPSPGAEVIVTKVKTLDGHASCALARGKKRYIYEFMAKLDWKMIQSGTGSDLECTGSLALPDIDGTIELGEGYEIHEFMIESVSESSLRPLIERFVQRGGFHDALNTSVDDWVRRFKKEF
jgi:tetratricopeptide (TPR) repeat protein